MRRSVLLVPFILIGLGGILSLIWWRLPLELDLGVIISTWSLFLSVMGLVILILLARWRLREVLEDCK
jgi:hypothetical protein